MCSHSIPRLFVSRRNDKNPNRFNCAVWQTDVSFLSRGPRGIWRHFKCKGHFWRIGGTRSTMKTWYIQRVSMPFPLMKHRQSCRKNWEDASNHSGQNEQILWGRGGFIGWRLVQCATFEACGLFARAFKEWRIASFLTPTMEPVQDHTASWKPLCVRDLEQDRHLSGTGTESVSSCVAAS